MSDIQRAIEHINSLKPCPGCPKCLSYDDGYQAAREEFKKLVEAIKAYREYQRQRADWYEKPNQVIADLDAALAGVEGKRTP